MNNFIISVKRIFKNKNTVTILGVLAIILLLYIGYSTTVNGATNPILVPVASQTIQPRTEITADLIKTIQVPNIAVTSNVIRSKDNLLGKYTNVNSVIPEGSMFFTEMVVKKSELPDSAFTQVKEGEIPYQFKVNMESTYGNSIYPENKIDIYMKAENEYGQVMIGRLLENVEVLAVKDAQGRHVFENTAESRTPAYLLFGVTEEIHILLRKTEYMRDYGVVLIPVPHGGKVITDTDTFVSTQYLVDFINANTVTIEVDKENVTEDENTENPSTENNVSSGIENIIGG